MPKFEFRLQAALNIAERKLEEEQKQLAIELDKLAKLRDAQRSQAIAWNQAKEMQREAGMTNPQDLGVCQVYSQQQLTRLRIITADVKEQERAVITQRIRLLEAHKEVEKLNKLKTKQLERFNLEQERREQVTLDETGQIMFQRNQTIAKLNS